MKTKSGTKVKAMIFSIFVHSTLVLLIAMASLEISKKSKTEIEITTTGTSAVSETKTQVAVQPLPAKQEVANTLPEKKKDEEIVVKPQVKPLPLVAPKKAVAKPAPSKPIAKETVKESPVAVKAKPSDDNIEIDESELPQAMTQVKEPAIEEKVVPQIADTLPEKNEETPSIEELEQEKKIEDPQAAFVEKSEGKTEAAAPQAAIQEDEEDWTKELQAAALPVAQASPTGGAGQGGSGSKDTGLVRPESELTPQKGNPQAIYPPMARLRKVQGTAVVRFSVNEKGQVNQAWLQTSSGSKAIDEEALKTQKTWKYQPGKVGIFQKSWVFRLTGEPEEMPYKIRR
jgi:TonB family protein